VDTQHYKTMVSQPGQGPIACQQMALPINRCLNPLITAIKLIDKNANLN